MTSDYHRFPIIRVDEDDPHRCTAVIRTRGQCFLRAVEGTTKCPCHGGNILAKGVERENIFKYRLAKYQVRLDQISESDVIKSLRDEIAILRFLVQKRLEIAGNELLLHSSALSKLILQISSLTQSCAKVEHSLEEVMEKSDILTIAHNLILACRKYVPEKESLDKIIDDITAMMDRLHKTETGSKTTNYKIQQWENELSAYLTNERIVSVRGEIGVMRLLIEERLNSCRDVHDLTFASTEIANLIGTVEKLVTSCHKLETTMGLLVDKDVALEFGQELILIIGNHIQDSDALLEISQCL